MKVAFSALAVVVLAIVLTMVGQRALNQSTDDLLQQRAEIEQTLPGLAIVAPAVGQGPSGCVFAATGDATSAWIELEWPEEVVIDEIILAPILYVEPDGGTVETLGWCERIDILFGDNTDTDISITLNPEEALRPAPHVFPVAARATKRLKIRADLFPPSMPTGKRTWRLAEVLVFANGASIAGDATITASPELSFDHERLNEITDGHYPYEMIGAGAGTPPYQRYGKPGESITLTVQLNEPARPDQVVLFPPDRSIIVPWRYAPGNGTPARMRVAASDAADFADSVSLVEADVTQRISSNPIVVKLQPPPRAMSFFRFEFETLHENRNLCALSELQLIAANENAALHATVVSSSPTHTSKHRVENLFDGKNRFGDVLHVDEWMRQMAERQALEVRLAAINTELTVLFDRNSRVFHWIVIVFVCIIAVSSLLYLYNLTRVRAEALESQELLLAEMHDEIGASLHAIRMFAEVAEAAPEADQSVIVGKIHKLAEETADSVRRVTHVLDEGLTGEMFLQELKQYGKWLPARVSCSLELDVDDAHLCGFSAVDLGHFLRFYHECLTNINRHAEGATNVVVTLSKSSKGVSLVVENDGDPPADPSVVPASLQRRARLAKGTLRTGACDGDVGFRTELVIRKR
jgi:signal transduction histidine kinase